MLAAAVAGALALGPDRGGIEGRFVSTTSPNVLEFHDGRWRMESGTLRKWGVYRVERDEVALRITGTNRVALARFCRDDTDVFRFDRTGDEVRFRAVGPSCDHVKRYLMHSSPWRRTG